MKRSRSSICCSRSRGAWWRDFRTPSRPKRNYFRGRSAGLLSAYNAGGSVRRRIPMLAARRHIVLLVALAALFSPPRPSRRRRLRFPGGSEAARAQVREALEASSFDWGLVPATVTIQIVDCGCAGSRRASSSSTRSCWRRRRTAARTPGGSSSTSTRTRSGGSRWTTAPGRFSEDGWAAPTFATSGPASLTTITPASGLRTRSPGRTGRSRRTRRGARRAMGAAVSGAPGRLLGERAWVDLRSLPAKTGAPL